MEAQSAAELASAAVGSAQKLNAQQETPNKINVSSTRTNQLAESQERASRVTFDGVQNSSESHLTTPAKIVAGMAQKMGENQDQTPAQAMNARFDRALVAVHRLKIESQSTTASYYLDSPAVTISSTPVRKSPGVSAATTGTVRSNRAIIKAAHPNVCNAVASELRRIFVRGSKFSKLSTEAALRLGQCKQVLQYLRDQTQLSNSASLRMRCTSRLLVEKSWWCFLWLQQMRVMLEHMP